MVGDVVRDGGAFLACESDIMSGKEKLSALENRRDG